MADVNPVDLLQSTFPETVKDVQTFRDELTVIIDADAIAQVCEFCRDTKGLKYNLLSDITGIDYFPAEPRFAIAYHLYSLSHNRSLRLKVYLPGDEPSVATVTPVFPAANWFEREILDMFGIQFEGHPDPRRILMPEGWDGHPLRKDYPLGYETVQFSFNYDEVNKHKPYAKE